MELILEPERFIEIFPEFALENRDNILFNLQLAHGKCGKSVWCDKDGRLQAIALLTAHYLAMRQYQLGAIASVAVESVKGSVMSLPKMDKMEGGGQYASTFYGQRYLDLWRSLPKTGFVV